MTLNPHANVAAKSAVRYGLLRELTTTPSYRVPQVWAALFDAAGFAGIRYPSRFTTDANPNSWATFGPAGAGGTVLPVTTTSGRAACAAAGIPVEDPGAKSTFRFISGT